MTWTLLLEVKVIKWRYPECVKQKTRKIAKPLNASWLERRVRIYISRWRVIPRSNPVQPRVQIYVRLAGGKKHEQTYEAAGTRRGPPSAAPPREEENLEKSCPE